MPEATERLAVLIDADNISSDHIADILEELATFGRATVKRAYGDWSTSRLKGWREVSNEHAIVQIQQAAYTTRKNSTDFALIIDAMDLLYSGHVDAFAIVSSDSDFTRLATRLRESGRTVYGIGERKTPQSLVNAVDRFIYLEVLGKSATQVADAQPEAAEPLPNLQSIVTKAVNRAAQDDGWAHLGTVGSQLHAANASFDTRLYGFDQLLTLVQAQSYLTVEGTGSATRVALKGKRAVTRKAAKPKPG